VTDIEDRKRAEETLRRYETDLMEARRLLRFADNPRTNLDCTITLSR